MSTFANMSVTLAAARRPGVVPPSSIDAMAEGLTVASRALDVRDAEGALAALTPLLSQEPIAPAVRWMTGRYFGLMRDYAEAANQFKLAVADDPSLSHVEFDVEGRVVRLSDVPGSPWAAMVLEEFSRGTYHLASLQLAPGDTVLDIGAHIGGVSIILAVLHPDARIIAYEPASANYASLVQNLAANGITNVTAVQQAVMAERGEMTITWSASATAGSTVGLPADARAARERRGWSSETVQCVTLDDVFDTHGIARCAWLKLDCEGAEWGIVRTTDVLSRIDRIAMELHMPMSRQAEGLNACIQDFASHLWRVPQSPEVVISSSVWMVDI